MTIATSRHVATNDIISFFSWLSNITLYESTALIFVHSSVDRHLGYFRFVVIMGNAAMNICIDVFVWTYVFSSLG